MTNSDNRILKSAFVQPGEIMLAPAALKYARDFAAAIATVHGDGYVLVFDWAQSITVRPTPDAVPQPVADCLMLSADERKDVPSEFLQKQEGVEFVITLPPEIVRESLHRVIDLDTSAFSNLILR